MEWHDVHDKKTKQQQKHKVFSALCILTKNYSGFVICGGEGRGALTNAAKLSSSKDKDISSSKDNGKHRAMWQE